MITQRWRLIRGKELYDIKADPAQERDIAQDHPDVVARLRAAHEAWWQQVAPALLTPCPHILGNHNENPTRLDAMDVMGDICWDQPYIREARRASGNWAVEVESAGRYRFRLTRWPDELGIPMNEVASPDSLPADVNAKELARRHGASGETNAVQYCAAELTIDGQSLKQEVAPSALEAVFELQLNPMTAELQATFTDQSGGQTAAYYVYVERLAG